MSGSNSSGRGGSVATDAPLAFTVHSLPSPALADDEARRTASGRWKMLGILAVCAAPVVASYFTYFVVRPQARTNYGELVTPARAAPDGLPLATLAGEAVAPSSLQGQWLLVVVGGAACERTCESQLLLQRQLREALGPEKGRVDKVWLVSDAAAPRAEVLQAVAHGDPVTVLRVPAEALARWLEPAPGHALGDHLYVVDPMGRWMMREPASPDASRVKRDLDRLLRASAGWDRAGR
ncbi:MAG TPA: hypothetical protein VFB53_07930 [Burkholderiales bacterium]|nr:hypothetical protein [Burkholderiales bacterium]